MSDTNNPLLNPDGMRRYDELIRNLQKTADEALAIAIAGALTGTDAVLDIAHGGTGSSVKNFVDLDSNQFNIGGSKIFTDSCGFQNENDVVDSGELAGNIRVICCTPQAADVGPQLRFSGKYDDLTSTVYAFGTIAGRKFNSVSGDQAGYLQFATTDDVGTISERARLDHEGTFGIGSDIPLKGLGNRIQISGGDIFIDRVGGQHSLKIGIHDSLARFQAVHGFDQGPGTGGTGTQDASNISPGDLAEHAFLSTNVRFESPNLCFVDEATLGTTAIQLKSFRGEAGEVRVMIGEAGECPIVRANFHRGGLDVIGDIVATGNSVAGGALNQAFSTGNCDVNAPGFVTGDNIKFGNDDPNGIVCAPIGAFYGRNNPDTVGHTFYVKTGDNYGPNQWQPVNLGSVNTICVDSGCPETSSCPIWYDTQNNMLWFWKSDAKKTTDGTVVNGAWVSSQVFTFTHPVPLGERPGARSLAQSYRGSKDKHYVYVTPTHILKNVRSQTGRFDLFIESLVVTWRQAYNGRDPNRHYYVFDLVTLKRRQGNPTTGPAKQQWPGDRSSYAVDELPGTFDADDQTDGDDTQDDDLVNSAKSVIGLGHTFHPNLPLAMVIRGGDIANVVETGTAIWEGTIGTITGKKITYAETSINCFDASGSPTPCNSPKVTDSQWRQQIARSDNDVAGSGNYNPGYLLEMTSGGAAGQKSLIQNNTASDETTPSLTLRSSLPTTPAPGDTFRIYSVQYKRIIARVSTKGSQFYSPPNSGPYGDNKLRDIQDFLTTGAATTTQPNNFEGAKPGFFPATNINQQISINYLLNLNDDDTYGDALDAVILAGLWDSIGQPGKLAASVCVAVRLALPPDACAGSTGA
jgi:hypothetical protein